MRTAGAASRKELEAVALLMNDSFVMAYLLFALEQLVDKGKGYRLSWCGQFAFFVKPMVQIKVRLYISSYCGYTLLTQLCNAIYFLFTKAASHLWKNACRLSLRNRIYKETVILTSLRKLPALSWKLCKQEEGQGENKKRQVWIWMISSACLFDLQLLLLSLIL